MVGIGSISEQMILIALFFESLETARRWSWAQHPGCLVALTIVESSNGLHFVRRLSSPIVSVNKE